MKWCRWKCLSVQYWRFDGSLLSLSSTSPSLPGPFSSVHSTCCSCELTSIHRFVLLFFSFFIMLKIAHPESAWMKEVVENCTGNILCVRAIYESVCVSMRVSHFCCLLKWSTVRNSQLSRLLKSGETILLQTGLDQKWTRLSLIQPNYFWLWGQVWSHTLQSPWISFFGLLFIMFFYVIHDICTNQLSLKNCTRQTDIYSSQCCQMFSIIYCRDLDTQRTLYFVRLRSTRNISKALLAVFSLYFSVQFKNGTI